MQTQLARVAAGAVAILLILGFLFLYGAGIWDCWLAKPGELPKFGPEYVYVATALAGLVGGVVAMFFNEKLPDAPNPAPAPASVALQATPSASGVVAGLEAVKQTLKPNMQNVLQIISTAYVIVYFVAGVAAIATWIKFSDQTPDLVKNLALISIGLFVAIARSFFSVPPPK